MAGARRICTGRRSRTLCRLTQGIFHNHATDQLHRVATFDSAQCDSITKDRDSVTSGTAARAFHFAAVTRADAGTPDSLARGLETLKFGPGAHTPSERRTDKNQNEKGCSQIALHQTA